MLDLLYNKIFWLTIQLLLIAYLEKAVNYTLSNKLQLELFLTDEHIELTNNRAERAVKPFVLERKNFLFSDIDKGTEASALCYRMIETAKLNKLNPMAYLTYLLTELPQLGDEPTEEQLEKRYTYTISQLYNYHIQISAHRHLISFIPTASTMRHSFCPLRMKIINLKMIFCHVVFICNSLLFFIN